MKKLHFILFSFFIYTTYIMANPPKYHGEDPYLYAKEVYTYYQNKTKNIQQYSSQSNKIIRSFIYNISSTDDRIKIKNYTDNTVEKLLNLSKTILNLDENDYRFLQNPLKFYGIDNSYNDLTKAQIHYLINTELLYKIFESRSRITACPPTDVVKILKNTYNLNKSDKELINNPKKTVYYYVLKTSDYKDSFVRDGKFIKTYVNTNKIQKIIKYHITKNKFYPGIEIMDIKLKRKLIHLKTIFMWKYPNIETCTDKKNIRIDQWEEFKKNLKMKNCFNKDIAEEIKTIDNNIALKRSMSAQLENILKKHRVKHCHNMAVFLNIIKEIKQNIDKDYYEDNLAQVLTNDHDIDITSIQKCLNHKCVDSNDYCREANIILLNFAKEWGYIK